MTHVLLSGVLLTLLNVAFVEVHGLSANDAFVQYGLTPDFIPTGPESTAYVSYGSCRKVDLGNHLEVGDTKIQPTTVEWNADSGALYTLIMIDVDAPTPQTRATLSPYLHWMVTNISNNDLKGGDTYAAYVTPSPTPGPAHRYVFVIYKQCGRIANDLVTSASGNVVRQLFSVQKFTTEHNLSGPVAGNFFYEVTVDVPSI